MAKKKFKNRVVGSLAEVKSKPIKKQDHPRTFGKVEDRIELHVYDLNGNHQKSFDNVYNTNAVNTNNLEENTESRLVKDLILSPNNFLREKNFSFGKYQVVYNFFRPKILINEDFSPFKFNIKTISPSRTELEISALNISNSELEISAKNFISDLNSYEFFRDFVINLGNNNIILGLNLALNRTNPNNYTLFIKLYDPLPQGFNIGDTLSIEEQLSEPQIFDINLSPQSFITPDNSIELKEPNFSVDITKNLAIPTDFKSLDNLLSTNNSSSYRNLLNKLGGIKPSVDYTDFSSFIHFGSAKERILNFKYKMELKELYDGQINDLENATTTNTFTNVNITSIRDKIDNLIENLDDYERYLYFESTSFAWPKQTSTIPYVLYPATASKVLNWLGDDNDNNVYYGGRISTASIFDRENPHNLLNVIPDHIRDNSQNKSYEVFVQMIGQHFDQLWVYVKDIGEINDTNNALNRGISKDLVYHSLKSMGIDTFRGDFDRNFVQDLIETSVSASSICDYPEDRDLSVSRSINSITGVKTPIEEYNKEVWKRLYHNAPYLLKTKGHERGLRVLMNCYGIPDTILNVKEYGGPQKTSTPNYSIHNKFSYAAAFNKGIDAHSNTSSSYSSSLWHNHYTSVPDGRKSIEMRFKTPYKKTQTIWKKDAPNEGGYSFTASLEHSSSAIDSSYEYYDYGRLVFTASNAGGNMISGSLTDYAPIYDDDWWSYSLRMTPGTQYNDKSHCFNGNNYVNIDSLVTPLTSSVSGTISFWTKTTQVATGSTQSLVSFSESGSLNSISISFHASGLLRFQCISGSGNVQWTVVSNEIINNGVFNHFSFTQDGTQPIIRVNAKQISQSNNNTTDLSKWFADMIPNASGGINSGRVGSTKQITDKFFYNGYINDLIITNDVKTQAEIEDIYNNGIPKDESNLTNMVAYVRMGSDDGDNYNSDISNEWSFNERSNSYLIFTSGSSLNSVVSDAPIANSLRGDLMKVPNSLEKQNLGLIKYKASSSINFNSLTSGSVFRDAMLSSSIVRPAAGFSGSIQEYREWDEYLQDDIIKSHAESIELFNGNTYSSSYENLYFRLSLGANLNTSFFPGTYDDNIYVEDTYITSSYFADGITFTSSINMCNPIYAPLYWTGQFKSSHPNQQFKRSASFSGSMLYVGQEETQYTRYPNGSAHNLNSAKIRIESSSMQGDILSPYVRVEKPAFESAPVDSHKLGIYFSPTDEINKDIIGELGPINMDEYLGDPRNITGSKYGNIELLETQYKKKKISENLNRHNFGDFIRLIQFYDASVFKMIEKFVPARTKLIKGLVIEPTFFDRNKIPLFYPTVKDLTYTSSIESVTPTITGENIITEVDINVGDCYASFDGDEPLYGNYLETPFSNYYASIATPTNTNFMVVPLNPDIGIEIPPPPRD